jgi:hypothetical protein
MARNIPNAVTLCAARFMVWRSTRGLLVSIEPREDDSLDSDSLPLYVGRNRAGYQIDSQAEDMA